MEKYPEKKVLFVINPKAGTANTPPYEDTIKRVSKDIPFEWAIYKTKGEDDAKQLEKMINNYQPDSVIAIGGDGTINLVATLLINKPVKLGIIPNGSANGLAYNLTISSNFKEELIKCLQGNPVSIDVVKLNSVYCFHLSDIGINARAIKRFEEDDLRGFIGYTKQFIRELFTPRSNIHFTLSGPDFQEDLKGEMIVIANAVYYGTGVPINPSGDVTDGKFEIVVLKKLTWRWLAKRLMNKLDSTARPHKLINTYSLNNSQITFKKPQVMHIDGEIFEDIDCLEVKLIPKAVQVLNATIE